MRRLPMLAIAALLACAALSAGEGQEVQVGEIPRAWVSRYASPLVFSVRHGAGGMFRATAQSPGWLTTYAASAPAGAADLETTMFTQNAEISWQYAGMEDDTRSYRSYPGRAYMTGENTTFACVDGILMTELEQIIRDGGQRNAQAAMIGSGQLPRRWQSYAGLSSTLVMDAKTVASLDGERRAALSMWLTWLGGRLWLLGGDGRAAVKTLGLRPVAETTDKLQETTRIQLATGSVHLLEEPLAETLAQDAGNPDYEADPLTAYYPRSGTRPETDWLFTGLGGVSAGFIVVCLLLLGVILGPVNYFYVRKRKNGLLFYVITPLVALAGTVAIVLGSMLVEGFGGRYNQIAILVGDGGGDALLYDLRVVRSGFTTPVLRFPEESLLVPLNASDESTERITDLSGGVELRGGWLKPRFATGHLAARPVAARMRVELQEGGDGYYVVNGLGFALESVAAALPDGGFGLAENVPPGGRAILRRERNDGALRRIGQGWQRLTGEREAFNGVRLAAKASSLPYLDDGGLGGWLVHGDYYYLEVGDAGGPGQ